MIFGDDSGVLYALDMNLSPSSADWPMLQHDLQRTGYFNFTARSGFDISLDFQIVDVSSENTSVLSERSRILTVDVAIAGSGQKATILKEPCYCTKHECISDRCTWQHLGKNSIQIW